MNKAIPKIRPQRIWVAIDKNGTIQEFARARADLLFWSSEGSFYRRVLVREPPTGNSLIPTVNFERVKALLDKALCMDPSTDGVPIYELVAQARTQIAMAESHDTIIKGVFGDKLILKEYTQP